VHTPPTARLLEQVPERLYPADGESANPVAPAVPVLERVKLAVADCPTWTFPKLREAGFTTSLAAALGAATIPFDTTRN
jgi:hypothetical protein